MSILAKRLQIREKAVLSAWHFEGSPVVILSKHFPKKTALNKSIQSFQKSVLASFSNMKKISDFYISLRELKKTSLHNLQSKQSPNGTSDIAYF